MQRSLPAEEAKMLSRRCVLVIAVAVVVNAAGAQTTWYVDDDADPAGSGTDWASAFTSVEAALNAAAAGDEIHVAGGVYRPAALTDPDDPRSATFQLISGVALRGGYAGLQNLADPDARDCGAYESILSGDIGATGDDADNSYHVVTGSGVDATAVLDGFTITAGRASGVSPNDCGAGMYNLSGSPTIINCLFTANVADTLGGGMCNELNSSPALTDCVFLANESGEAAGGMFNVDDSSPTLVNCAFTGNVAVLAGGMANQESQPTLFNCTFDQNAAHIFAGGVYNTSSDAEFTNCALRGNVVESDSGAGGAIVNQGCSPTFANCRVLGNTASAGGGVYNCDSAARCVNCTLVGNAATGATYPYGAGGAMINHAGGGMQAELVNCIVWQNTSATGSAITDLARSATIIRYSCIESGNGGENNMVADPQFVDADGPNNVFGDDDDDVRLLPGSPCIDAGDNLSVPPSAAYDFEGDTRFADADGDGSVTVDIGADEYWVDCNENGETDAVDIAQGYSLDANGNGVPDECDPRCIGDLNADNTVGLADLAALLGNYGTTTGAAYEDGDLDWDGDVDLSDLATLLGVYGTTCITCPGDFTGDGHIDLYDLAQMMGNYGATEATHQDGDFDLDGDVDVYDLAGFLGVYDTECP